VAVSDPASIVFAAPWARAVAVYRGTPNPGTRYIVKAQGQGGSLALLRLIKSGDSWGVEGRQGPNRPLKRGKIDNAFFIGRDRAVGRAASGTRCGKGARAMIRVACVPPASASPDGSSIPFRGGWSSRLRSGASTPPYVAELNNLRSENRVMSGLAGPVVGLRPDARCGSPRRTIVRFVTNALFPV